MKTFNIQAGPYKFPVYCPQTHEESSNVLDALLKADFTHGGIDIETSKRKEFLDNKRAGLDPYLSEIRLVQIYTGKAVAVFDLRVFPLKFLRKLLIAKKWVAHSAVFETAHLTKAAIPDLHIDCSAILSRLIYTAEHSPFDPTPEEEEEMDENPNGTKKYKYTGHSLLDCCGRDLGIRISKEDQASDWGAQTLTDGQLMYAASDAVLTYKLYHKYMEKIKRYNMGDHYDVVRKLQQVVANMQLRGFPVDWKLHTKFVEKWDEEQGKAQRECYKFFGNSNLSSGKQLSEWLVRELRKEPEVLKRWPTTKSHTKEKPSYSFNATTLSRFKGVKGILPLLELKRLNKLLSTYGESFAGFRHPVTGRIHSTFTLAETRTGRFSSFEPNLQNWPRGESRAVFTPGDGKKLVVADYSQIELQVQAELSRDPVMLKAFAEGRDIYCEFGSVIYGKKIEKEKHPEERKYAKEAQLAFSYGMGCATFITRASKALGYAVQDSQAEKTKNAYYSRYRAYIAWCDKIRRRCEQLGYSRTVLGKMRHLSKDEVYTKGPNHIIQGSSFEMMAISMIHMDMNGVQLVNTVHDEAIAECVGDERECKEQIEESMRGAYQYLFPDTKAKKIAEANAGKNWLEAK